MGVIVAALLGVVGTIWVAFLSCAVSELAARLGAWLYSPSSQLRATRRDEWLALLDDMSPRERPAQAGSMLWIGVRRSPDRYLGSINPSRRGPMAALARRRSGIFRVRGLPDFVIYRGQPMVAAFDRRGRINPELTEAQKQRLKELAASIGHSLPVA